MDKVAATEMLVKDAVPVVPDMLQSTGRIGPHVSRGANCSGRLGLACTQLLHVLGIYPHTLALVMSAPQSTTASPSARQSRDRHPYSMC